MISKKIIFLMVLSLTAFFMYAYADSTDYGWVTLVKSKYSASSILTEKGKPEDYYGPDKAFDEDPGTSWCEGSKGDGTNESITVDFKPQEFIGIIALNGFGKYRHLYYKNNRVKKFKLTFFLKEKKIKEFTAEFGKDLCGMELEGGKTDINGFCIPYFDQEGMLQNRDMDNPKDLKVFKSCVEKKKNECIITDYLEGGQMIFLKKLLYADRMTLTILSTYKGKEFDDTCISDIRLLELNEISPEGYEYQKVQKY